MTVNRLYHKWRQFVRDMNSKGIPIPVVRDPRNGKGSVTATLVVVSAGIFGFCIMFMLATAITKWAGLFVLTPETLIQVKTASDYSFQFLLAALGGYLGRHFQKGESIDPPAPSQQPPPKIDDPDQQ